MTIKEKVLWSGQISDGPSIHKMVTSLTCYQDISGGGYTAGPIPVSFGIIPQIKFKEGGSATHLHCVVTMMEKLGSYYYWNVRCEFIWQSILTFEGTFDLERDGFGKPDPVYLDIQRYSLVDKKSMSAKLYQLFPVKES